MEWFSLTTANDLYEKLKRDFTALQHEPASTDLAFNFFVTAWHLLDWKYPGNANAAVREARRNGDPLLQLLDNLANGLKHFKLDAKKHKSVQNTGVRRGGWFGSNWFASNWYGPKESFIELDGPVAAAFGPRITVLELAERVMRFWDQEIIR